MKPLRLHGTAERELREAALFYNAKRPGLGEQWLRAFEAVAQKIGENPAIGRPRGVKARQYRIPVFPYSVIFQNRVNEVYVFAVAHLSRKPDYWMNRLDDTDS